MALFVLFFFCCCCFVFHLFQRSPWTTICILEGLLFVCSCLSTGLVTFWLLANLQGRIDKVGCTLRDFDSRTGSQPKRRCVTRTSQSPGTARTSAFAAARTAGTQTGSQLAKPMNTRQKSAQKARHPECHLRWSGNCGWSQQLCRRATCRWPIEWENSSTPPRPRAEVGQCFTRDALARLKITQCVAGRREF